MEEPKAITTVSIAPVVLKGGQRLANYHGFRSFSNLVESLVIDWLNSSSPDWLKETQEFLALQELNRKVGESKEGQ